jgi:hypothetical protein
MSVVVWFYLAGKWSKLDQDWTTAYPGIGGDAEKSYGLNTTDAARCHW